MLLKVCVKSRKCIGVIRSWLIVEEWNKHEYCDVTEQGNRKKDAVEYVDTWPTLQGIVNYLVGVSCPIVKGYTGEDRHKDLNNGHHENPQE